VTAGRRMETVRKVHPNQRLLRSLLFLLVLWICVFLCVCDVSVSVLEVTIAIFKGEIELGVVFGGVTSFVFSI